MSLYKRANYKENNYGSFSNQQNFGHYYNLFGNLIYPV